MVLGEPTGTEVLPEVYIPDFYIVLHPICIYTMVATRMVRAKLGTHPYAQVLVRTLSISQSAHVCPNSTPTSWFDPGL